MMEQSSKVELRQCVLNEARRQRDIWNYDFGTNGKLEIRAYNCVEMGISNKRIMILDLTTYRFSCSLRT
jgi:hypothetical protein